jgi:hypothetical protein
VRRQRVGREAVAQVRQKPRNDAMIEVADPDWGKSVTVSTVRGDIAGRALMPGRPRQ